MGAYASVVALARYGAPFPLLVGLAKGRSSALAQRIYRDIFLVRLRRALEREILAKGVERVVLSPLRWKRLVALEWHTHAVALEALRGACGVGARPGHGVAVVAPLSGRLTSQASMPSAERRERLERFEAKEGGKIQKGESGGEAVHEAGAGAAILVVDDVLTSGETAASVARRLRKKALGTASPRLHFLCVFRAPVPGDANVRPREPETPDEHLPFHRAATPVRCVTAGLLYRPWLARFRQGSGP